MLKSLYALQPYRAGSKAGYSLVIVLPADVVRDQKLTTSTVLGLRVDRNAKKMTLERLDICDLVPTDTHNTAGGMAS